MGTVRHKETRMHPLQMLMETQRHQAQHLQRQAEARQPMPQTRPDPPRRGLRRRMALVIATMSERG
jgi:hypothetical protein